MACSLNCQQMTNARLINMTSASFNFSQEDDQVSRESPLGARKNSKYHSDKKTVTGPSELAKYKNASRATSFGSLDQRTSKSARTLVSLTGDNFYKKSYPRIFKEYKSLERLAQF